jgi:hypothetical protein
MMMMMMMPMRSSLIGIKRGNFLVVDRGDFDDIEDDDKEASILLIKAKTTDGNKRTPYKKNLASNVSFGR